MYPSVPVGWLVDLRLGNRPGPVSGWVRSAASLMSEAACVYMSRSARRRGDCTCMRSLQKGKRDASCAKYGGQVCSLLKPETGLRLLCNTDS